jgi:tricorn protease
VWWPQSTLIPGLIYGIPQLPIEDREGRRLENLQITPDVLVPPDPEAWASGKDPSLVAAVNSLLPDHPNCVRQ